MRTSNPALSEKTFTSLEFDNSKMTLEGTVSKSFILILLLFVAAYFSWNIFTPGTNLAATPTWYYPMSMGALIAAFVLGLIITFKKTWAPYLAPLYAICEGLALGFISAFTDSVYPGIVVQSVLYTFGVFLVLLFLYRFRIIKVTENLKLMIISATAGIAFIYLLNFIFNLFGRDLLHMQSSSPISIAISLVITAVAAFNLVLDFDFIEKGIDQEAPSYMEWYSAFALILTLVWLYLEILSLQRKLKNR